ncbi:MAG: peptidase domain-containing ABC transporter [Geminicoccaceae bacterium]
MASQLGRNNYRPSFIYLGLSSLFINILSLSLPILSLQVYDRILVFHGLGTLNVLLTAVIFALALEITLRIARSYTTTWAGAAYEHHTSCQAIDHQLMVEPLAIERRGISGSLQNMAAIGKLTEFVGGQAMVCLIDLPFVCLYLGLIAVIAGYLALVPFAILIIFAGMAWFGSYELKNALVDQEDVDQRQISFLIEALGGIHSIKSMGAEAGFLRRHERLQTTASIHKHRIAFTSGGAAIVGTAFGLIMMVAVTATGAVMVIHSGLSVGALVASVLLSGRIMQPIQRALGIWIRYQDVQLAKNRVDRLFATPIMIDSAFELPAQRKGSLELRDLAFSYQDDGSKPLFRKINLSLGPGDWISVSGGYGSGKSALLKLMAGLLKPTSGSVLIEGVDAHSFPTTNLVKYVGYLATKGTIFDGTVRDNLSAFNPDMEIGAIEMARFLGIEQAIASMPLGYDTVVTDSGSDSIPSGLKQCIALARVLAHKPRLLLFDNADRALDQDNYNHLFRLLGRLKGKVAMVIVSDDRNFLRLAKEEYLLVDGHLVKQDVTLDSKVHDVRAFQELPL